MPVELINEIMGMGITVHVAMNEMDQIEARHKNVEWVCGKVTVTTSLGYVSGRDLLLKRIMDIIGGMVAGFTLGSLLFGAIMLLIGIGAIILIGGDFKSDMRQGSVSSVRDVNTGETFYVETGVNGTLFVKGRNTVLRNSGYQGRFFDDNGTEYIQC